MPVLSTPEPASPADAERLERLQDKYGGALMEGGIWGAIAKTPDCESVHGKIYIVDDRAILTTSAGRRFHILTDGDAEPLVAANDNEPRGRFELTWFDDIAESEPKEHVIQGVFGVDEFTTVSGLPGAGKSVIATDMACHVAAGMEWHGRRVRQGLVVYIAAERKALTERRMAAFRKRHGVEDVPLLVLGGRVDLTAANMADARAVAEAIGQASTECGYPCVLIVVDTLTRTFGAGDQNQAKDMGRFVQGCDELRRLTGSPHVTVIHHTAWTGERGKGAIDLDGAVDASFIVKKSGKTYALDCNGANDGEEGNVVTFAMESVQVGTDSNGDPTTAPVVVLAAPGPADNLLAAMKGHAAKVFDALHAAIAASGVEPEGDHYPDGVLVVTEEQWRQAYYGSDASAKPDTLGKRFRRARTDLLASETVHQVGQWYWPI